MTARGGQLVPERVDGSPHGVSVRRCRFGQNAITAMRNRCDRLESIRTDTAKFPHDAHRSDGNGLVEFDPD